MNMNPSQFLQTLVAITLDLDSTTTNTNTHLRIDPAASSTLVTDQCSELDRKLVSCLSDVAKLDTASSRQCILCPIARTRNSRATTCRGFEDEGFCEDCQECEETDCPAACWPEFDEWLRCKLVDIGCPEICRGDDDGWDFPTEEEEAMMLRLD